MSDPTTQQTSGNARRFMFALIPLAIFLALAGLFLSRLGTDSSRVPSALIGRSVPAFNLPPLEGMTQPGFADADLRKSGVTVINISRAGAGPAETSIHN